MRGLITANLKVLRAYPNDNDKFIIPKRGSKPSGNTPFSSLDGIGSNKIQDLFVTYTIIQDITSSEMLVRSAPWTVQLNVIKCN